MIRLFIVAVALFYPFIIYFGLAHFTPTTVAGFLAAMILLRILLGDLAGSWKLAALIVVLLALTLHWWMHDDSSTLKFYPVLLNGSLLLVFGASLFRNQPLIETIARKRGMDVMERNKRYLRVLTMVWTGFFAFSVIISTLTAIYANMDIWLLYNGFASYILIGALILGELIVRHFYKRRYESLSASASPNSGDIQKL